MPNINDHTPDEFLAAFLEDSGNAPLALYAGAALDAAGRTDEALCVWTIGDDTNPVLRTIHQHMNAGADLRQHSLRADTAIRAHFNNLHRTTVDEFGKTLKTDDLDRIRGGIWTHYATGPVDYKTPKQKPETFYIPDLPAYSVAPREKMPWAEAVEAAYADICSEYEAAINAEATQYPYVPNDVATTIWSGLRGKMDWSALYLHFNASLTDEAGHFPKTLKALEAAPLVSRDGLPLETFFSRLKPGAHIPPHCGLTNSRLTVHLPLIVPDGCEIRVGDDLHKWEEGKIIGFDDSFEHEAWNRADSDRAVLIFETHHPDLSPTEIEAIERVYAAFDGWVKGRFDAIGLDIEALKAAEAAKQDA